MQKTPQPAPRKPTANPANQPPNGTYGSNCAGGSQYNGSFTYNNGAIVYTLNNTQYQATNQSNGNAIVFSITVGGVPVRFDGLTPGTQPNGKAKYSGSWHSGPGEGDGDWTATQS